MSEQSVTTSGGFTEVVGLTASRGLSAALQAATYLLVARAAAPSEVGRVLAALAVATAAVAVLDLGISNHVMRELGRGHLGGDDLVDLWWLRVVSPTAGATLWVVVTAIWSPRLIGVGPFLMAESLLGFTMLTAIASNRTRLASGMLLLARALALALVAVVSRSTMGLPWALAAGGSAAVTLGTFGLRDLARGRTRRPRISPRTIRHTWHYMTTGVLAQLSNLDLPIVASIAGSRSAGLYGLPSRLATPLMLVAQSHANIVLPRAAAAWQLRDGDELRRIRRSVMLVATACAVPLVGLSAFAHVLVPAILGNDYRGAVAPLRVIVVAVGIATVNAPLIAMLQAVGRSRTASTGLFVAVPIGLLGVAAGAALLGTAGAGLGLVLMQALILAQLWPVLATELRRVAELVQA